MLEREKYEARYLISVVSAIINQTEIPRSVRSLNWETIYKLAEYHKVAHIVYLVTLGLEDGSIAQKWKQLFRERYAESLLSQERYRNAAQAVMQQLKKEKIHALLIKDGIMSTCYEPRELRALTQVRIFVEEGQEAKLHSLMRSMDFQKQENRKQRGDAYYRVPGTTVIFYTDLGFYTRRLKKYFDFPVKVIREVEGEKHLHQFTENEFFIYLMCDMVNLYACGEIKISDVVDYWQFYKKYQDRLDWEYIDKELTAAGILDFSQRLRKLAQIWFGEVTEALSREYDEEIDVYHAMEDYIMTRGAEGREISSKLTELIQEASSIRARQRRRERAKRYRGFVFPDRDYMEKIFPVLEDAPFLMPLCWLWRSFLLALRPVQKKIYRLFNPVKRKLADVVEDIQVRHEEKMMQRMDEAVRQVMEESNSSVGQEVHDILDQEWPDLEEEAERQIDAADAGDDSLPEELATPEEEGLKESDLEEGDGQESGGTDSPDGQDPEVQEEEEVFGMRDFFMDS